MKRVVLLSAITVAAALGGSALPASAKVRPNPHSAPAHSCPHGSHAAHGDCVSDLKSKNHK